MDKMIGEIEKLQTPRSIEKMYFALIALFMLLFGLVPFFDYGLFLDSMVGSISVLVALLSFLFTYKLYGWKSIEGKAWAFLFFAMLIVLISNLANSFGYAKTYFVLRFISIPVLTFGLIFKVWYTGPDFDLSQKTTTAILFTGWALLTLVSSLIPALEEGFNYLSNPYPIFAFTEIFALLLAIILIQTIKTRGWYFVALGLLFISMGDIFHPLASAYSLMYPGSPIRLFWYVGMILAGYGAFHQRKEHIKLLEKM
ncbi:MAG: hypothetical protein R6W73_06630 [Candidatus Saliniplasma sp.]